MAKIGQKCRFLRFPAMYRSFGRYLKMGGFWGILGVPGGSGGVVFPGGEKVQISRFSAPPEIPGNFPPGTLGPGGGHFGGSRRGVIFGGILWVIPEPHPMACRCKMLTLKGEASLTRHRDPMHVHSPIALHVDDDRNVNDE